MYFRDANAALVVYDMTESSSFEKMQIWIQQLLDCNPPVRTIGIAANKADKAGKRTVTREQGQQYVAQLQKSGVHAVYGECSALSGVGIHEVFEGICRQLVEESHEK